MPVMLAVAYLVFSGIFSPALVYAKESRFEIPDLRDDFCGAKIDYRICKCALHNEMCDSIGMDKKAARVKLDLEFDAFVKKLVDVYARQCMGSGGIYSTMNMSCEYCPDGKVRDGGVCVDPKNKRSIEEKYNLPKVSPEGGSQNVGYVVSGEGEFFVYSPGRGKWIGPVSGGGLQLFEGDVLHTTTVGRAQIRLGTTNTYILERTTMWLPSPKRERTFLERGATFIWETVKALGRNDLLEIEEGAAHSITGRKGTTFYIEANEGRAVYSVLDGSIEVWLKDAPSKKLALSVGESAEATPGAVSGSEQNWDALLAKSKLTREDFKEPEPITSFAPIDPDAVNPSTAAYNGDLTGGRTFSDSSTGWASALIAILALVGAYIVAKKLGWIKWVPVISFRMKEEQKQR